MAIFPILINANAHRAHCPGDIETAGSQFYAARKLGRSQDFPYLLNPEWDASEGDE
jgi:hypothetical protein